MRATAAHRGDHVGKSNATTLAGIAVRELDRLPIVGPAALDLHRSAEHVWVRHSKRTFRSIDLDESIPASLYIEARHQCRNRAADEIDDTRDMRRHFNLDLLSTQRLTADRALGVRDTRRARNAPRRTKKRNERSEVIRPHVE